MSRYLQSDLETLDILWKQTKKIKPQVFQLFEKSSTPYSYVLRLVYHAFDFNKNKGNNTFTYAIMQAFDEWAQNKAASFPITLEVKKKALKMVLQHKNLSLIRMVIKTFKIHEEGSHFVGIIEKHLEQEKFSEAYCCVVALNVQEWFTLDQIVLPLIFQEKIDFAVEYLKNYPVLQLELVKMLDSVCLEKEDVQNLIGTLKMTECRKNKLDHKWVQKGLWNILKKCSIPLENCPNLRRTKIRGTLKYMMYRKYIEQSISASSWEELVIDCVKMDNELHQEILVSLIAYDDVTTALRIAAKLEIPREYWPEKLVEMEKDNKETAGVNDAEYWDETNDNSSQADTYLSLESLEISSSHIHMIETTEELVDCLTDIMTNYTIVGIDAEWKPSFGVSAVKLSLLQLAVSDKIFLIDFFSLSPHLEDERFELLFNDFFCKSNILKLGYGISTDLKTLGKCYRGNGSKFNPTHVLDVGFFHVALLKRHPELIPAMKDCGAVSDENTRGLSKLCQTVLGKRLSKNEQFSDWERRPLRKNQVLYAALDAYCLLKIYEVICEKMLSVGLNASEAVEEFILKKWKEPVVKKSAKTKIDDKAKENNQVFLSSAASRKPISIKDFRVVVDNMLQGLGKYLRIYGADVIILDNDDAHTEAVKIALSDERIILSNGAPYRQLSSHVPEDMCFYVPETIGAKEQIKYIFDCFNVQVADEDIFSRCSVCNSDDFLAVPSCRLMYVWLRHPSDNPCWYGSPARGHLFNKYCTKMKPGVCMQLENLSSNVFSRVKDFMVCTNCGKVYWEGTHHDRARNGLTSLIPDSKGTTENTSEGTSGGIGNSDNQELKGDIDQYSDSSCEIPDESFSLPCSSGHANTENSNNFDIPEDYSHTGKSYNKTPTIMHFDEDSDEDESEFIIFNS